MAMCEPLQKNALKMTESQGWIYSRVAFLASLLASPDKEKAKKMIGISGLRCFALWEKSGQGGYWARMSQDSCQLLMFPTDKGEHLEPYCMTWPRWGTVLDGVATELVMSERRTKGTGYSSWPTPRASLRGDCESERNRRSPDLPSLVKMCPTPIAGNHRQGNNADSARIARKIEQGWTIDLHDLVKCKTDVEKQGQLNADWVECLMGFPIGWTDVESNNPVDWPGWPAALMGEGKWPTPSTADRGSEGKGEKFVSSTGTVRRKNSDGTTSNLGLSLTVTTINESGQYPYEPPRVITGQKNRAKRLKCCGNAVSPYQVKPIFDAIVAIEEGLI